MDENPLDGFKIILNLDGVVYFMHEKCNEVLATTRVNFYLTELIEYAESHLEEVEHG